LALTFSARVAAAAKQLPMVWMDDANGYAIGGYDPVHYFVKGEAVRPNKGIEAQWGGRSWNFRNVGNREAFLSHPHVYAPRFGGMDPFLMVKDRGVQGNPVLFDIYKNRLYLFYNGVSHLRWKEGREGYAVRAALVWPKVAIRHGLNPAKWIEPEKPQSRDGYLFPHAKSQ